MTADDGRLAPVEGVADDTVASFRAQVSQAARDRAGSWDAVAAVLEPPDERLAELLRSGELSTTWRLGARWLGEDAELFTSDLMSLDVYARGSRRRSVADDLARLRADHAELVGAGAAVAGHVRAVAELCRREADAWSAGDMAGGKELRAAERALIEEQLVTVLPDLAGRLATGASAKVWRTLGRVVLAVLSVESGRDYRREVLGGDGD
ncbi:hypothetical protein [Georgenia subflava]|uniref:Uncharacterized protein n=1 Tax=Georgenia subflava TaxID=1622177 RepID=A0A6N7EQR3_9MICO|nr:hypothetical protein [Georgenia subflava]MPV38476.1 hypothetical protein [Georgenia subflava]